MKQLFYLISIITSLYTLYNILRELRRETRLLLFSARRLLAGNLTGLIMYMRTL